MPRTVKPITDIQIKKAKPKEKIYKIFDGGGLFLQINPTGSKVWRMKYRFNGKEHLLYFGKYPYVSLQQAREKRDETRMLIGKEINPSDYKKEQKEKERERNAQTFEKTARAWHTDHLSGWQESTAKDTINRLEKDVFPEIGNLPIHEITRKQIIKVLEKIENRGAFEIAKRLKAVLIRIFRYAIQRELIDKNPASDIDLKPAPKGHFAAIKSKELPELLRDITENKARLYLPTRIAMQLMMLVFVRTSELITAEWEEVDLKNKLWVIPYTKMKMGRRKINPDTTDHKIYLSRQAVELLEELKEHTGKTKYLFPNKKDPQKHMSNNAILKALERMGYKGKMTGHGFRTLAVSTLQEMGYRREVADRQLAHKESNKIQAAYFRADFEEERKKMLQDWADYIDRMKFGNVVKLKRA